LRDTRRGGFLRHRRHERIEIAAAARGEGGGSEREGTEEDGDAKHGDVAFVGEREMGWEQILNRF
jgi:hypothetical protein